jgi:type I restriction enzyme M protein
MLGIIFEKAQNKIQDPAKLRQLIVELIGKENWLSMSADVKGEAYEGLLERNAQDVKGGAGQYFTPRALIQAIVDCVQPAPGELIIDPACGTGGFLLAVYDYLAGHHELDRTGKRHLRFDALRGVELVPGVSRLCAMNLFLHGVGPDDGTREPPIRTDDALRDEPDGHFDVVVTNPPFGKKSSITVVNEEGETDRETLTYNRPDFWTTTSNKQLNFVQHVKSLLKIHGRAAVVVPDNVLFEGGCGRDRPAQAPARVRRPHAAAIADWYLLRARGEGQRRLLRTEARREGAVDEEGLGVRPPHQQALHAQDQAHDARRSR